MSGLGPTRSCHEVSSIFEEMFYNDGWELRREECALFFVLHDPDYLCNLRKKVWLQHVDDNVLIYMFQAWYWGGLIKNDGSANILQCLTDFGTTTARGRVKNTIHIRRGNPAPTLNPVEERLVGYSRAEDNGEGPNTHSMMELDNIRNEKVFIGNLILPYGLCSEEGVGI
jgi:hypothetical protein